MNSIDRRNRISRYLPFLTVLPWLALCVAAADSGKATTDQPATAGKSAATGEAAKPAASTATPPAAPVAATREEVEELRTEVAELKADQSAATGVPWACAMVRAAAGFSQNSAIRAATAEQMIMAQKTLTQLSL